MKLKVTKAQWLLFYWILVRKFIDQFRLTIQQILYVKSWSRDIPNDWNYRKLIFDVKMQQKKMKNFFWFLTGFELGTFGLWSLHASKRAIATFPSIKAILLYLRKCHWFRRFLHNKSPNEIATKKLAQISIWQLKYLQKRSKVALKKFFQHCFS